MAMYHFQNKFVSKQMDKVQLQKVPIIALVGLKILRKTNLKITQISNVIIVKFYYLIMLMISLKIENICGIKFMMLRTEK